VAYVDLDVAAAHSLHSAPASSSSDSFWPWSWPMFRQSGSERSQDGGVSTTTGSDPFGDTSPNGDASHAGPGGSASSNAPKSLTPEQKRERRARALYLLDPHRIAQLVRYRVTCISRHSFAYTGLHSQFVLQLTGLRTHFARVVISTPSSQRWLLPDPLPDHIR